MTFNYLAVASHIEDVAEKTRGMIELAAALKKLGSMEEAEKELQRRLTQTRVDFATATRELDALKGQVAAAQRATEAAVAEAMTRADRIIADAQESAQQKLSAAATQAEGLVQEASEAAKRMVANAEGAVAAIDTQKDSIETEIVAARAELVALKTDLIDTQSKLDAANAAVAQIFARKE